MRLQEHVSLWMGIANNEDDLDAYVQQGYSDDGDLTPSQFMKDFNIPSYDEDFLEAEFLENPVAAIAQLLQGFSYDDQLIPRFTAICGNETDFKASAVVLLYNYKAQISGKRMSAGPVQLTFMGVTQYSQ